MTTAYDPQPDRTPPGAELIAIRRASTDDLAEIVSLVNHLARRGQLLPRSEQAVYRTIDDWLVAESGSEVLGCVSLLRYTSGLVEVRSLAVRDQYQGLGIGSRLMEGLLDEARARGIQKLFALTRVVPFFLRFGFSITDRAYFPEKVWHDCRQCPFIDNCDETAVVLELF